MLAGRARATTELARLRRLLVRLHRLLAPEPSALFRRWPSAQLGTARRPPASAPVDRRVHAGAARFGCAAGPRQVLQDESLARVGEENDRSLFRLTMVTVLARDQSDRGSAGHERRRHPAGGVPARLLVMLLLIGGLTALCALRGAPNEA